MSKHKFNRNFAVVIGINDYKNGIRELETAVTDAYKLAQILQKQHQALKQQYQAPNRYEVQLILNQRANFNQLNQLISDFKNGQISLDNEKVTVTKDDRVLFYFAGHGIALEALENQEGPVGYLIPQDAILGDSMTYLPMQELHDALNALPCRHMLAILDCCFAGAFRWASLKREIVPKVTVYKERYDRFISDAAWQVITSAADDQKALDSLGLRGKVIDGNEVHSPFAKALFDALRGGADEGADLNKDGIITATELYSYLRDQVEILTENHYKRQTPGLCPLRKHDKGEFIFLLPDFDRDKLEDAPPLNLENNPYRGLQSYDEKDSHLFFGRENLSEKLYKKAVDNKQALTLVLGASGTGKSSLMKAGLLHRLRDSQEHQFKILDPMRPGESPLKALAQVCLPIAPTVTASELAKDEQALANIIEHWSKNYPNTKLLLPVDQFEELITLCKSDQEREQFQTLIKNAIAKYPDNIHIVITLRLDFEAQFQNSVLKDFWNDETRFVVPPMSQDEFREVIEKPALEKVVYFDPPSLVDELINEVIQMPGALPLLSFTLSELYLKYLGDRTRDNRALTKKDYEELGKVIGSLTKRANDEYDRLVAEDPTYKDTVRRVMLRMISLQGGELARRQVPKAELIYPEEKETERVNTVIKYFSEARLIVEGSNLQGEPYVEPAHDALVQGWDKMLKWKKEEEENLILQQRLTPAAEEWNNIKDQEKQPNFLPKTWGQAESFAIGRIQTWQRNWQRKKKERTNISKVSNVKSIAYLWDDDPRIEQLNQVLDSKDSWLNWIEDNFVRWSVLQKGKNTYRLALTVTGIIASLAGLSIFALIQLQYSLLREKAATVRNQLASEPVNSLVRAIQATGESDSRLRQVLSQVEYSLSEAVAESREQVVIRSTQGAVLSVAFSPDGQTIVSGGKDGTIRLWDLTGKPLPVEFSGHQEGFREEQSIGKDVNAVAFSPDGQTIVSGGSDGTVRLWDLNGKQIDMLRYREPVSVTSVAFNSTDKKVVSSTSNGAISLWNPQNKAVKLLATKEPETISISPAFVTFSPNGQKIAGIANGKLILWDNNGNQLSNSGVNGYQSICSIAFSSDSQRVIIGRGRCSDGEGTISQVDFDVEQWQLKEDDNTLDKNQSFSGNTTSISSVASGLDGMIASGSADNTIRLWQTSDNSSRILRGHTGEVNAVAFNPKQQQLASASSDGTIRLWDTSDTFNVLNVKYQGLKYGGESIYEPNAYIHDYVNSTAFSPDGNIFAVARQNMVMLISSQGELVRLPFREDEGKQVASVAFSPDGKTILSGISQYDDTIQGTKTYLRLWDLNGNTLQVFQGHKGEVNSVAFSPDGKTILSGSSDKTLRLWDLNGNTLQVFQGHKSEVNSVAFSPDGKTILSGSNDKTLRLWDLQGRPTSFQVLTAHSGALKAVAYSPDGKTIISASTDQTIKFWNPDGSLKVLPFQNLTNAPFPQIITAAFSSDGRTVLTSIQGLKEMGSYLRLIRERRDWKDWLTVACNRLRYHEVLVNPATDEAKGAKATCQNKVLEPLVR